MANCIFSLTLLLLILLVCKSKPCVEKCISWFHNWLITGYSGKFNPMFFLFKVVIQREKLKGSKCFCPFSNPWISVLKVKCTIKCTQSWVSDSNNTTKLHWEDKSHRCDYYQYPSKRKKNWSQHWSKACHRHETVDLTWALVFGFPVRICSSVWRITCCLPQLCTVKMCLFSFSSYLFPSVPLSLLFCPCLPTENISNNLNKTYLWKHRVPLVVYCFSPSLLFHQKTKFSPIIFQTFFFFLILIFNNLLVNQAWKDNKIAPSQRMSWKESELS